MKKIILLFLLLLSIIISFSLISAVPQLPMIVTGNVSINDNPAKIGTEITAVVNGEKVIGIETTEKGKFNFLLQKLNESDEAKLYVDGIYSEQTISYKSGDFKQLTLKVNKSYLFYYLGAALILILGAGIIWKYKKPKIHGKK